MRSLIAATTFAALAAALSAAQANPVAPDMKPMATTNFTCEAFTAATPDERVLYMLWLNGFAAGAMSHVTIVPTDMIHDAEALTAACTNGELAPGDNIMPWVMSHRGEG